MGGGWEAVKRERARIEAIKEAILAKHADKMKPVAATEPVSTENLNDQQVHTLEIKKALHDKYGLKAPKVPKPIGLGPASKKKPRELEVFVQPFSGIEPSGAAKPPEASKLTKAPSASAGKTPLTPASVSTKIGQLPEEPAAVVEDQSVLGLATLLTDSYGIEWTTWEPETVDTMLKYELGVFLEDIDGVLAFALLMNSDTPWTDWTVTEKVVIALNGRKPQFVLREHVSPAELAHAVAIMRSVRRVEWTPEVLAWIAATVHHHGLVWLSPPLDIAQEELARLNKDSGLTKEVQEYWSAVEQDPELEQFPFKETPVGVQLARLTAIKLYQEQAGS